MPTPPGPPGQGLPRRSAEDELGLSLTDLAGAKVTLLVRGRSQDKPNVRLEIELKSGRAVLRPLPAEFLDEKSGLVRVKALAEWLHLEQMTAVDAIAAANPESAEFIDRAGLARQLQVDVEAPLSALPVKVRPEQERWTFHIKDPWTGLTRLALGEVSLAGKEKISFPAAPAASTISLDPAAPGQAAVPSASGDDAQPSGRGCLPWALGLVIVAVLGLVGLLIVRAVGSDSDAGDTTAASTAAASPTATSSSASATASGGQASAVAIPVAEYADTACGIFADKVVAANARFQAALTAASGTNQDIGAVYQELAAAASEFSAALAQTSEELANISAPDVSGGDQAHQEAIGNYAAAGTAAKGIATAAGDFDPTTANQEDAAALGEVLNQRLSELNAALSGGSGNPQIDAAFEASEVCAKL